MNFLNALFLKQKTEYTSTQVKIPLPNDKKLKSKRRLKKKKDPSILLLSSSVIKEDKNSFYSLLVC